MRTWRHCFWLVVVQSSLVGRIGRHKHNKMQFPLLSSKHCFGCRRVLPIHQYRWWGNTDSIDIRRSFVMLWSVYEWVSECLCIARTYQLRSCRSWPLCLSVAGNGQLFLTLPHRLEVDVGDTITTTTNNSTTTTGPTGRTNAVFGIYIAHINLICSVELLILILLPINTFTYRQAATTTALVTETPTPTPTGTHTQEDCVGLHHKHTHKTAIKMAAWAAITHTYTYCMVYRM